MIPFSPPKINQKIIDEVADALRSGWITTGPKTKLFEKKLQDYCSAPKVLCVSSATAGLELVLRWYGVKEGDEVIIPAYTYCATANVVVHCGAKPVMVDVDENDFLITVDNIRKAITSKTKAIIPVDIAGLPCDYDEINKLVKSEEIKKLYSPETDEQRDLGRILILSDAAHSIGATYKGLKTGILTDITVFSFHAVKNLTTAEGGAIVFNLKAPFNNEELYNRFNILSLHGQTKDALAKTKIGNWRYDIIEAGYKANMTDLQAAIGLVEIDNYDQETLSRRKEIFDRYTEGFKEFEWANLPIYEEENRISSYHVYLLRIIGIDEQTRDKMITRIFEKQVSVNVHFQPLPLLTVYKNKGYDINDYPVAYQNYSCEISLPVYFDLTDKQVDIVVQAVINSYEEVVNGS